jgi:UDP:flavonoid glycosyltransferase YjiC (YdhE family)
MGVPQVVLPMWVDLYDYAVRAEWLGVGVYGNNGTAPEWTAEGLVSAFLRVLGDDDGARRLRERARALGEVFKGRPGAVCSAEELARLARLGV